LSFKKNIIRILLLTLWIVLGSSVLVLLVAAINIKNHKLCKGIEIEIVGVKEIFFLDKADILKVVADEGIVNPAGKAITGFNLQRLEAVLEKNVWVKDAELFFDNNLLLHINILEKEPVARIFTRSANSFYMDSSGSIMPLNNKINVKLPVFTGFPDDKKQSQRDDSILVSHIKNVTMYILNNKFWLAQIAQVDITADKNFEMIPTVGNHIIEFGNGDHYESKFNRLMAFYKQVLSHTGINTYSRISVQYNRQVIGTKKGMVTKIDSVQALKNIQRMIEEAKKNSEDSVYAPLEKSMTTVTTTDSMIMDLKIDADDEVSKKPLTYKNNILKPVLIKIKPIRKTTTEQAGSKQVNKSASKPMEIKTKPKAVMGKLSN
jgi:cell division protein FtsQ